MERKKIAILISCHNRKIKTLACLNTLYKCYLPDSYGFDVFLVDDGSTDNTSDEVRLQFPNVKVITGDGNLYWNRGMHLAWLTASQYEFDFYLWLNDDTYLFDFALIQLLNAITTIENNSIIVGTTCSSKTNEISYGGFKNSKLIIPNGELQSCTCFNGNCVLISSKVFNKVGNLDFRFRHAVGDIDYGLRATRLGVKLFTTESIIGNCEPHSTNPIWCNSSYKLVKRLRHLYSPLGNNPIEFFVFENRHYGLFIALKHFFSIHLRVFIPRLWYKK